MGHKLLNVGLGIMSMAAVIIVSGNREPLLSQQTTPSVKNEGASKNRKDSNGKTIKDLTEQINYLESRIRKLETEQDELRGRLVRIERPQFSGDLSQAGSELARFNCEPDFNRAHALAITQGTPGYFGGGGGDELHATPCQNHRASGAEHDQKGRSSP